MVEFKVDCCQKKQQMSTNSSIFCYTRNATFQPSITKEQFQQWAYKYVNQGFTNVLLVSHLNQILCWVYLLLFGPMWFQNVDVIQYLSHVYMVMRRDNLRSDILQHVL